MSLLTLERSSPSPHESENEDLLSTSSYEGFVAREHYALCLTPRPITSLGPGRRGDHIRIFSHLKKLVKLLRPADKLKLAVELENSMPRRVTKYMVVIITHGNQEMEETIVLGTEQEKSNIRIGLVLPLWRDTEIKLDGDGGFSVHTGDRQHVFKPLSVQSMWTALQTLYKCTEHARMNNYYVGGLSHTWMSYYSSRLTTDGSILNEWNLSEDIESFRPDSSIYSSDISGGSEERRDFEKALSHKLRGIMLEVDLEETTSKQLRLLLEKEVNMELKKYREFLDREMLRILGQMERPSKIFDYLFLGSEWNASNLSELKEQGVKYILNITKEIDNFYPEEFKYLNIRLYDVPGSELMKHWDKTFKFIKEAKLSGKKVLVHCKRGISRSAATVMAYTMKEYNMSLNEAIEHVKSRRSVVSPNDGFMQQLRNYEGILKARHNTLWGKQAPSRLHPLQISRKLFHSEPSLQDYTTDPLATEPKLSFLPEEGLARGIITSHQSLTRFPPDPRVPVDKQENIRNFLASLPPVVMIDDDQGIGEFPYNSESGSGYSTPNSSPTDDEQFNVRVQKLLSKRDSIDSNARVSAGAIEEVAKDEEIKSEGEVTCNVHTEEQAITEQTPLETKPLETGIERLVGIDDQIKTVDHEYVSVPGSIEFSSLSPNPSSHEDTGSSRVAFRLGSLEPEGSNEATCEPTGTVESPQIHSVPERVKEIEKLSSKSEPNLDVLKIDSKVDGSKVIVTSRNSSVHSQLSSCDHELAQLEQTDYPPTSHPHTVATRHESLSPSPSKKRPLEHVRCSSLVTFPSTPPPPSDKCDSENVLNSSLCGAVRARIMDIEEKKGKDVSARNNSTASERSEALLRSTSPTRRYSEELPQRPASVAVDDLTAAKMTSGLPPGPGHSRMSRRESTPPAVFSAWSNFIPDQEQPPIPVQDLKRKFEYSRVNEDGVKVGGGLRRSQSLRTVDPPQRKSHPRTLSPEQTRRGEC